MLIYNTLFNILSFYILENLYYINDNIINTANIIINKLSTNLQIYFNHVVYGTSKYDNANINSKLVGAIIPINPYIVWNDRANAENIASSVTVPIIGVNTPATV